MVLFLYIITKSDEVEQQKLVMKPVWKLWVRALAWSLLTFKWLNEKCTWQWSWE